MKNTTRSGNGDSKQTHAVGATFAKKRHASPIPLFMVTQMFTGTLGRRSTKTATSGTTETGHLVRKYGC